MKKSIIASFFAFLMAGCAAQKIDNTPVKSLDLQRYLGEWYEIARFDHRFERGLEYCKANYVLCCDNRINVVNTGIKNGEPKTANGKATITFDKLSPNAVVKTSNPATGDHSRMYIWGAATVICIAAAVVLIATRRKEEN